MVSERRSWLTTWPGVLAIILLGVIGMAGIWLLGVSFIFAFGLDREHMADFYPYMWLGGSLIGVAVVGAILADRAR